MPTAGVIVGPQTTSGLQLFLRSPNTQNHNTQQAQVTCNGTQILLQQPRQQSNQVNSNLIILNNIDEYYIIFNVYNYCNIRL